MAFSDQKLLSIAVAWRRRRRCRRSALEAARGSQIVDVAQPG
ncbi:MAG TPA: hypothetical protein VFZ74_03240 [Burkholderiales bacterium]